MLSNYDLKVLASNFSKYYQDTTEGKKKNGNEGALYVFFDGMTHKGILYIVIAFN